MGQAKQKKAALLAQEHNSALVVETTRREIKTHVLGLLRATMADRKMSAPNVDYILDHIDANLQEPEDAPYALGFAAMELAMVTGDSSEVIQAALSLSYNRGYRVRHLGPYIPIDRRGFGRMVWRGPLDKLEAAGWNPEAARLGYVEIQIEEVPEEHRVRLAALRALAGEVEDLQLFRTPSGEFMWKAMDYGLED